MIVCGELLQLGKGDGLVLLRRGVWIRCACLSRGLRGEDAGGCSERG